MQQADKDEGCYSSGYLGHRTGHWANEAGYQARQRELELDAAFHKRQNDAMIEWHARRRAAPVPRPPGAGAFPEGPILDAVSQILGVLAALALVALGYGQAILPPVWAGGGMDWAAVWVAAITAGIGYAIGANALVFLVRLFGIALTILLGLLKLALVIGGLFLLARLLA